MITDWESPQSDQLLPNAKLNSAGTQMVVPRNKWGSIPDISMAGGICFALSTEWCISCLRNENFEQVWPSLKDKYGERFYKMWRFYLLSCAAVFRSRYAQLWQIVMTRTGTPQPDCRIV